MTAKHTVKNKQTRQQGFPHCSSTFSLPSVTRPLFLYHHYRCLFFSSFFHLFFYLFIYLLRSDLTQGAHLGARQGEDAGGLRGIDPVGLAE